MTTIRAGRWLLVAVALVGVAFAASAVSAHGIDTPTDHLHNGTDTPPYDGTDEVREGWMGSHATEHVGAGPVEWMASHVGVTVAEMAEIVADGNDSGHAAGYPDHHHAGHDGLYGTDRAGDHGLHPDDTHPDDTHPDDTHPDDGHRGGYGMTGRGHGC